MAFAPLSMPAMFAQTAAKFPDRPLVRFQRRSFTYAQMQAEARAFAAGLQAMGVAKGDRVGLFLPNVPTYTVAYFGAMMAGAVVVNFSPLYTAQELEAQVVDSGVRLMVTLDVPALLPTAITVLRDSPLETLVVASLASMLPWPKGWALRLFGRKQLAKLPQAPDIMRWSDVLRPHAPDPVEIDPLRDPALLQYTGGTTGTPKGAVLSHQNLTVNARQVRAIDLDRDSRDVVLGALPLFHVFANACVQNRTVANGGCIVMLPRFDAGQVLATIAKERPTAMFAVPTMLQALLDHPRAAQTDCSSIRVCVVGGAPMGEPLRLRFEQVTGVRVVEGYGLTECSGVASTNPLYSGDRPGTIGQPVPGTRLRLLDKDDPAIDAPAGEPGELAISGPQVMLGYWNHPEAAATAFAARGTEMWLRTGDVATIDDEGFVRIVDRIKDMIVVGGFKVFPSQIEAVMLTHPAVKEALVIGMADAYHGEVPRGFVTLNSDVPAPSADELKDWINQRVGKHERLDAVVIRLALPKTMIGKLDRKALRAEAAT